jgi:hypothetical protein
MTKQEIIKQVEAIIYSEPEDIFFIRDKQMVKCVMSIESLKIILATLKKQTPKKDKETENQRRNRLMKHYRN